MIHNGTLLGKKSKSWVAIRMQGKKPVSMGEGMSTQSSLADALGQARECLDGKIAVLYRKSLTGDYVPILSSIHDTDAELPAISAASDLAAFLHGQKDDAFRISSTSFKDSSLRAGLRSFGANGLVACQLPDNEQGKYYLTVALESESSAVDPNALAPFAQHIADLLSNAGKDRSIVDYEMCEATLGHDAFNVDNSSCKGTLLASVINNDSFETVATWISNAFGHGALVRIEDTDGRELASFPSDASLPPVRDWLFSPVHLALLDEFEYSLHPIYIKKSDDALSGGRLLVPLVEKDWLCGVIIVAGCFDDDSFLWHEISPYMNEALFATLYLIRCRESSRGRTLRRTLDFVDNERARIAFELHDETSQDLVALKVSIATVQQALNMGQTQQARGMLEDCERIADEILTGVNAISAELRPSELNYLGLRQAIDAAARSKFERTSTPYRFIGNALDIHFNVSQETALLTGVVEALSNCAKHARASLIEIDMCDDGRWFTLEVRDNGVGFNTRKLPSASDGHGAQGIKTMRDCAESIGGDFWIGSECGTGTTVRFSLPNRFLEGD